MISALANVFTKQQKRAENYFQKSQRSFHKSTNLVHAKQTQIKISVIAITSSWKHHNIVSI